MNFGSQRGVLRWAKSGARPLALFLVGSIVPLWPWWLIYGGRLICRTLGLGANSTIGWRAKALRWAKLGAALLTLFVFFSIIPVWPWWPTCGGELITRDYRDVYVDECEISRQRRRILLAFRKSRSGARAAVARWQRVMGSRGSHPEC
jgi:hypothetical protein